jgi:hypothetical protein
MTEINVPPTNLKMPYTPNTDATECKISQPKIERKIYMPTSYLIPNAVFILLKFIWYVARLENTVEHQSFKLFSDKGSSDNDNFG